MIQSDYICSPHFHGLNVDKNVFFNGAHIKCEPANVETLYISRTLDRQHFTSFTLYLLFKEHLQTSSHLKAELGSFPSCFDNKKVF